MMICILLLVLLFQLLNHWLIPPITYITCYHIIPKNIVLRRTIATKHGFGKRNKLLFHRPSIPPSITTTIPVAITITTKLKSIYTSIDSDHTKDYQKNQNINNDSHTDAIESTNDVVHNCIVATSKSFGNITRIQLHVAPDDDNDNHHNDKTLSYVEKMGIPTFVCSGNGILLENIDDNQDVAICTNITWNMKNDHVSTTTSSNIPLVSEEDDVIDRNDQYYNERYGPAFTISSILSPSICQDIISSCEMAMSSVFQQQQPQKPKLPIIEHKQASNYRSDNNSSNIIDSNNSNKKNHHGAMQLIISPETANIIAQRIAPFIPIHQVEERKFELDQHRQQSLNFMNQINNNNNGSTSANLNKHQQQQQQEEKWNSKLIFVGLNRRFRIYKYLSNNYDHFKPHIDAGFPPSSVRTVPIISSNNITTTTNILQFDDTDQYITSLLRNKYPQFYNATIESNAINTTTIKDVVSRLTILFYLNENFMGGTTNFYEPLIMNSSIIKNSNINTNNHQSGPVDITTSRTTSISSTIPSRMIASVKPQTGMCLIFPQSVGEDVMESYAKYYWPTHEGSSVQPIQQLSIPSSTTTTTKRTEPKYVIRSDLLFAEIITDT